MELLLAIRTNGERPQALRLELSDDVTVGELADHLAHLCGSPTGLTVRGLYRDELVAEAGPVSGSTVELAPEPQTVTETPAAPVNLTVRSGGRAPEVGNVPLHYGHNDLGVLEVRVSDRIEVAARPTARILVNGAPVIGAQEVRGGDLITVLVAGSRPPDRIPDLHSVNDPGATQHAAETMLVEVTGRLTPPRSSPWIVHHSALRPHEVFTPTPVTVPSPPEAARLPALPVVSAVVPLLLGAALWAVTRSAASALFVIFSFVYVVAAGFEARRDFRGELAFREQQFRDAAERSLENLAAGHRAEADHLERRLPGLDELLALIAERDERIWERRMDDTTEDALTVRLGRALRPGATPVARPGSGRIDLLEAFEERLELARRAELPVWVDLERGGGLGLVGHDEETTALARWLVLQLVALCGPDQVRLVVLSAPERTADWRWAAWLPHLRGSDSAQRTVVVVDGATEHEVATALAAIPAAELRLLWLTRRRCELPQRLRQSLEVGARARLVRAAGDGQAVFRRCEMQRFAPEGVTRETAARAAARLAPLVAHRVLEPAPSGAATVVDLAGVLVPSRLDDPSAVIRRWEDSAASPGLGVPVAHAGASPVTLDIVTDGPHALVAGMTGSGKSEALRSWLASLALHHPPEKVTFLLIDYKGGAAFGPLARLPHTVGLITDLDSELAARAVVSLRAELRRRERWLAAVGCSALSEASAGAGRPPALMVTVDEFATLAKEIPQFVDQLVDVAQRGRSLGIHLVLATQRPHGVVSEAIRANTSLRVALRVSDPQDSIDVIDVADACGLGRDVPGTAIISIGRVRSRPVRFVHSSGPVRERTRIRSEPLGLTPRRREPSGDDGPSQLSVAVAAVQTAFERTGRTLPAAPWVPPLPEYLSPSAAPVPTESTGPRLFIGLMDRPEEQRVEPLSLDLDAGAGTVIIGGRDGSAASALATIAAAAAHQLDGAVIYSIGWSDDHACDSIELSDRERVLRVLRDAQRRLDTAATSGAGVETAAEPPRLLLLIADLALFERAYETVNRGEALRILERIARSGAAAGINLVVGATRRLDLDPVLAVGFTSQIALQCANEEEAALVGAPPALAGRLPRGRGFHDHHWVQLTDPGNCGAGTCTVARPVPRLPHRFGVERLRPNDTGSATRATATSVWRVPLGLDTDTLTVAHLDLSHGGALITGPRRSGRSTTLRSLAQNLRLCATTTRTGAHLEGGARDNSSTHPLLTLLLQPRRTPSSSADHSAWSLILSPDEGPGPADISALIRDELERGGSVLCAVDDLPELLALEAPGWEQLLAELVALARTSDLRPVFSGEVSALARCYSEALGDIRSNRTGVLLQPDVDSHGALLGCQLERRDELAGTPGQGWIVNDGTARPVQVAHPAP